MRRYLRIAFSVACGIICLLLSMLWVRSYWKWDDIHHVKGRFVINFGSTGGIMYFRDAPVPRTPPTQGWGYRSDDSAFKWSSAPPSIETSHSTFVLLSGSFAVLPWVRWRFSLRTLLIAMTVMAALLGAIVWAVR